MLAALTTHLSGTRQICLHPSDCLVEDLQQDTTINTYGSHITATRTINQGYNNTVIF